MPSTWSCWLFKVKILLGYWKLLSGLWSIWSAWHLCKLTMILICNTNYVCWSVPSRWHTMTCATFHFWATVSGWQKSLPSNFELMMFFGANSPEKKVGLMVFTEPFLLEILCHWIHQLTSTNGWFTWTVHPGKGETSNQPSILGVYVSFWAGIFWLVEVPCWTCPGGIF